MEPRRLAIATAHMYPELYPDDHGLYPQLEALGVEATPCVWNDPAVDWTAFDAVLIRSIWDYFDHYPDFLSWLDTLDAAGVPTINDSAMLRWNADKRYLAELAEAGVATIPTTICAAADLGKTVDGAFDGSGEVVVKPTVSGTARNTIRGRADDPGFHAALDALPRDYTYMVQPFVPEIAAGEWSMHFFDGEYSHSIRKVPAPGDYRVQLEFGGVAHPADPKPWLVETAREILRTAARMGFGDHAYVRVDGVVVDGRFQLMELEMVEPFLSLRTAPGSTEQLARAVARRIMRS